MLHLARIVTGESCLVDLGGNGGNLFYLYERYIQFPADFRWCVQELPLISQIGAKIASERKERRLEFSHDPATFARTNVLLAAGVLQYWERPLPLLLEEAGARPAHVLVNRLPLSPGPTFCTVQDAGGYLAPAVVHEREPIVDGMRALGYELIDEWGAPELSLDIPLSPELSVKAYSGFYWRRKS